MAILLIPAPGSPDVEYSIDLEGVTYRLRYRWHERSPCWHLDLMDVEGSPIMMGIRLVLLTPLLGDLMHPDRPPGEFILNDPTGRSADPLYDDLGSRVHLYYVESATVAEIAAAS